ncbi:aldo/keto reductase [Congregibacter litoralis]|uniref:Putative oxidoreductase n=1 Tax=Congregibacter litoralis KT71 TaxID=314285 RepID=A4A767_9GAMM|nr:aldo/keto reductase [Congregibacter litoralis]EAQ98136.1 putative oxidoreductase [Congregibacter litoralis KT71]
MNSRERYTELAADLRISRVITGLWQIADMERDGSTVDRDAGARSMQAYTDVGLTTFDMADHYGSSEEIAGHFASRYIDRDKVQLLTKWVPKPGGSSRQTVREAVERALERLHADQVQLLQYHAWNYADPSYLDDLSYLKELQDEGLIAHLGLTNFDTAHLRVVLASGIDIVSNQVCFSLLDQRASGAMLALCQEKNVKLLAFGTLAGGFLSERWIDSPEPDATALSTWSQMKYKRYIDESGGWSCFQDLLKVLEAIAREQGASVANIASRYILEKPGVGAVIIGARLGQSEHIENTQELLSFSLEDEARDTIGEALKKLTPIHGDCGDEYRKPPFLTASGDLSHHIDALPPPYPTVSGGDGQTLALSGTIWEDLAGFSRAVRKGNTICVSGTTATHGDRIIGAGDPTAQTDFVIDKLEGALQSLGASLESVVRTRIFIRNMDDWEAVSKVHGARFAHIQPANTLVRADLVGDEYLVEIEADAICTTPPESRS